MIRAVGTDLGVSQEFIGAASTAWTVGPATILHRKSSVDAAELGDSDLQERAEPRWDINVLGSVIAAEGTIDVIQGMAGVCDVETFQDAGMPRLVS